MNAVIAAVRIVAQIDSHASAPEGVGPFRIATAGGHNAMNSLAQRRVMDRTWLVKRQVGRALGGGKFLRQQVVKHHHVSLLEDLHLVNFRARVIQQDGLLTRFGFIAA